MKLATIGLGCPKNTVDLETILGWLPADLRIEENPEQADAVLINTCAFIESAKKEAIDIILKIAHVKKKRPDLRIWVSGCLPQRYPEELAQLLPEVDAFFPSLDPRQTAGQINRMLGLPAAQHAFRVPLTPVHYRYLTISQGCNNRCSYCAIPLIKGSFRHRPIAEIVAEAHRLAELGTKELIVIGQDTTYYGKDGATADTLADVLTALNRIPDLEWIRLMYTHPAHWSGSLIDTIAGLDKVLNYVDLPIQHINETILASMGRLSTRFNIEELIVRMRKRIPDLVIRTSLIVGYPGESDQAYQELYDFVKETQFDRLGVFTYSEEEGTRAAALKDDVPEAIKMQRQEELMLLQGEISAEKNQNMVGSIQRVIVDDNEPSENRSIGRTSGDAPEIDNAVIIDAVIPPGTLSTVKITDSDIYDLYASIKTGHLQGERLS